MPKAGYCKECKKNVWINEDGSCQFGHPASKISCVYEAKPQAPKRQSKRQVTEIKCTCVACGHVWHYLPMNKWQERAERWMYQGKKMMASGRRLQNLGSALTPPFFLPGATMPMRPVGSEPTKPTSLISECPKCKSTAFKKEKVTYNID